MSKALKNIVCFTLVAIMSFAMVAGVNAQLNLDDLSVDSIANQANLDTTATPSSTIAYVIRVILALLGVIALLIIIIGGFKWMTSGGDSEKIGSAKKLMGAGVVGMIIVIFAYIIQQFVVGLITGGVVANT